MLKRRTYLGLFLSLFLMLGLTACGAPEGQEVKRDALKMTKGMPHWIRHIPKNWGCDQTINGRFVGRDSAHAYSFPGKAGYKYTFSFDGRYKWFKGAVIAIYDAETMQRVAYKRRRWSNRVFVQYTSQKNVKYIVAVYSIWGRVTAKYTLKSKCKRTQYCVEFELPNGTYLGKPQRVFLAHNVNSYAAAQAEPQQYSGATNIRIREGTCGQQHRNCPRLCVEPSPACPNYKPVCSFTATINSLCALKVEVRQQAGDTGIAKKSWIKGACPAPVAHCVEFRATDKNGNIQNTFYAKNVKSYKEGKDVLAQFKYFADENIRKGTCEKQYNICPNVPRNPICGEPPAHQTFANVCEFKSRIREDAGATGQAKGKWNKGACSITHCLEFDNRAGRTGLTFHVFNVNSRANALALLSQYPGNRNAVIKAGKCGQHIPICSSAYKPVCSFEKTKKTYDNVCLFKNTVRKQVGNSGSHASGWWDVGACAVAVAQHCVEFDVAHGTYQGKPQRIFYAFNAKSYADALAQLKNYPKHKNSLIRKGACGKQHTSCPRHHRPVCSYKTTYGNLCQFKITIRRKAGNTISGAGKGTWIEGACLVPVAHCVEFQSTDRNGKPHNTFYARNVNSYKEGKDVLAQFKYFTNEKIRKGTCEKQSRFCPSSYTVEIKCPPGASCPPPSSWPTRKHPPVCGNPPSYGDFVNVCTFQVHIRGKAGASGQFKGSWDNGACKPISCGGITGVKCPAGYVCLYPNHQPNGTPGRCAKK